MPIPLHYRPWQGRFRPGWTTIWPIARVAVGGLLRRRLFWVLYSFGLLLFLMFFFGTYLLDWAETQIPATPIKIGKLQTQPDQALRFIRQGLQVLNGSQETFAAFFSFQGTPLVLVLALAGSVMVGADYTQRSLPFYLSKPLGRRHYLLGKGLALGVVVQMASTLPALILYLQHGFDNLAYFTDPDFFQGKGPSSWLLLAGVVGYGLLLTIFLSLLMLAVVSWMRQTLPVVMVWISLFLFPRWLANLLVDGLQYNAQWRLVDLWNNLTILGRLCLGYSPRNLGLPPPQPTPGAAAWTLVGVALACLIYLNRRTRAADILR